MFPFDSSLSPLEGTGPSARQTTPREVRLEDADFRTPFEKVFDMAADYSPLLYAATGDATVTPFGNSILERLRHLELEKVRLRQILKNQNQQGPQWPPKPPLNPFTQYYSRPPRDSPTSDSKHFYHPESKYFNDFSQATPSDCAHFVPWVRSNIPAADYWAQCRRRRRLKFPDLDDPELVTLFKNATTMPGDDWCARYVSEHPGVTFKQLGKAFVKFYTNSDARPYGIKQLLTMPIQYGREQFRTCLEQFRVTASQYNVSPGHAQGILLYRLEDNRDLYQELMKTNITPEVGQNKLTALIRMATNIHSTMPNVRGYTKPSCCQKHNTGRDKKCRKKKPFTAARARTNPSPSSHARANAVNKTPFRKPGQQDATPDQ